jgi:HEAT repeat protein
MSTLPGPSLPFAPETTPLRTDAEELVRALVKTLRIRTIYEPNNPIYREFSDALIERFDTFLARHKVFRVEVREDELLLEGQTIFRGDGSRESLPFTLYKDGIRELAFFEGLEPREIFDFLETVKQDPAREANQEDILSRLWERDFVHIRYLFVDLFLEEETIDLPDTPAGAGERTLRFAPADEGFRLSDGASEKEVSGSQVLEEARQSAIVKITPDDFDPTLYFLEREEVRYLREEIEHEKERNLLLDYLELLRELVLLDKASDDLEPVTAMQELFSYFFANGNLATVVRILDLMSDLTGNEQLSAVKRARIEELSTAILSPESLGRAAEMLEEEQTEEAALAEYLRRAAAANFEALVERLGDLKRLSHREEVLAPIVAAAVHNVSVLHRLFRHPNPAVVKNAIFLSGRAANRQSLEALEEPLHSRDAEVRIEAINALKTYRSARAMDLLVEAVNDLDKLVRYYALRNLISFNYRPALRVVTAAIRDRHFAEKDLTEKKLFFEAYGRFAGGEAIPDLREILGRRSLFGKPELRDLKICAATALGEIGGEEARSLLREMLSDRQPEVREACEQALARSQR